MNQREENIVHRPSTIYMLFLSFFIHSRAVHMLSILCDIHLSGRGSLFILSSLTTFMTHQQTIN